MARDDASQRLDLAYQAYHFALDAVRLIERRNHPDLSPETLAWRVTRRMQGDRSLGKEYGRLDLEAIRLRATAAGVGEAFDRALAMARQEVEGE